MRKSSIVGLAAPLSLLAVLLLLAVAMAPDYSSGPRPSTEFLVIATNAPGWMRVGGSGRYLCTGTVDNGVTIQQAITDCAAAGGGVVQLSPGVFYYGQPAAETVIAGTCEVYGFFAWDSTVATPALSKDYSTMLPTFSTGNMAAVVTGQIYRITGGDDGEGNTHEGNKEPLIASVEKKTVNVVLTAAATWTNATKTLTETGLFKGVATADHVLLTGGTAVVKGTYYIVSATADTAVLAADINGAGGNIADGSLTSAQGVVISEPVQEDYGVAAVADSDFKRIVGGIKVVDEGITIRGAGIYSTILRRYSGADCAAITFEGGTFSGVSSAGKVYFSVRDLSVNGMNGGVTTYDGDRAGIVLGERIYDYVQSNVNIDSTSGEGLVILQPWGAHVVGGWIEYANGIGLYVGDGNQGTFQGVKLQDNKGNSAAGEGTMPAIFLRYTNFSFLNLAQCHHKYDYVLRLHTAQQNMIVGTPFTADTGSTACVYIGGGPTHTSAYNTFGQCMFNTEATTGGVSIAAYNYGNMFNGCWFDTNTSANLTLGAYTITAARGNHGLNDIEWTTTVGETAITDVAATIPGTWPLVVLNPNGDYTLTSAPTIADGKQGQVLRITCDNAEANTVTVQDQGTLANSNLQLGAATRAIGAMDVLELLFDGTDWIEINYQQN